MKDRYLLIDGLRGLAIANMIPFHFLYDIYMVYGRDPLWAWRTSVHSWQQAICWTFILVSGFSWRFGGKHNLRRGLFFNLCGFAISLVTYIVAPHQAVWLGILNFMGCAVLLMIPVHKIAQKLPGGPGAVVSFLLFLLFRHVHQGYLSLGALSLALPRLLYSIKVLTPFGFPYPGFVSSDYFPILPWFFLYLSGYFLYSVFLKHESWKPLFRKKIPLLSAIGQKSIWIYLIHQPLCMLLCMLIFA